MTMLLFATRNLRVRASSEAPLPNIEELLPEPSSEMPANETTREIIAGNGPPLRT